MLFLLSSLQISGNENQELRGFEGHFQREITCAVAQCMDEKLINPFTTKCCIITSRVISQIIQNAYLQGMECFKVTEKINKLHHTTEICQGQVKIQKGNGEEDTRGVKS